MPFAPMVRREMGIAPGCAVARDAPPSSILSFEALLCCRVRVSRAPEPSRYVGLPPRSVQPSRPSAEHEQGGDDEKRDGAADRAQYEAPRRPMVEAHPVFARFDRYAQEQIL